jgi:hypothetical protein
VDIAVRGRSRAAVLSPADPVAPLPGEARADRAGTRALGGRTMTVVVGPLVSGATTEAIAAMIGWRAGPPKAGTTGVIGATTATIGMIASPEANGTIALAVATTVAAVLLLTDVRNVDTGGTTVKAARRGIAANTAAEVATTAGAGAQAVGRTIVRAVPVQGAMTVGARAREVLEGTTGPRLATPVICGAPTVPIGPSRRRLTRTSPARSSTAGPAASWTRSTTATARGSHGIW